MGILKKITGEYFKEAARTEDGKVVELLGHKVVVPVEFEEGRFEMNDGSFFDKINKLTTIGRMRSMSLFIDTKAVHGSLFINGPAWLSKRTIIPTGSNYSLVIDNYESLRNGEFTKFIMREIDESEYNTIVDFLKKMLSEKYIMKKDNNFGIQLVSEKELMDRVLQPLLGKRLDEKEFDRCLKTPFAKFKKEFGKVLGYVNPKSKFTGYFKSKYDFAGVFMSVWNSKEDNLNLHAIALSDAMRDWWRDELIRMEKEGVEKYFNLK